MKSTLLFCVLALASLNLSAQTEGFHRAKIYYSNPAQLERLAGLGVDTDHGQHK